MARLESRQAASCHRATLYRIAATLADEPESISSRLVVADQTTHPRARSMPTNEPATSWLCSRVFAARPDQVAEARAFLGRVLHDCPMVYEATVVCSERQGHDPG